MKIIEEQIKKKHKKLRKLIRKLTQKQKKTRTNTHKHEIKQTNLFSCIRDGECMFVLKNE